MPATGPTSVSAEELRYDDAYSNSHKFYRVFIVGNKVLTQWGRIGTAGQFKTLSAATDRQAAQLAADKIHEKRNKGYVPAGNTLFQVNSDMASNPDAYGAKFDSLFTQLMGPTHTGVSPLPRPNSAATDRNMNKLKKTLLRLSTELKQ